VTDQSGTGLVHSAPAHGHEDYLAFQKAGLLPDKLRCPVNDDGCFTEELADWSEGGGSLVGKSVLGDGVGAVVDLYSKRGILLAEETIEHRYPLDWKTKEPIIVRYVIEPSKPDVQSYATMVCGRRGNQAQSDGGVE
jgi:isoleucyl-tRNA synthetase